ncbi:MAG: YicC/YloC family endoribonuclease [Pseudomonadota bacterium]
MTTSMTGFGSADGIVSLSEGRTVAWAWELKGVNGKGLEVKLRLPQGYDTLDQTVRSRITEVMSRGTLHGSLNLDRAGSTSSIKIDEAALGTVLAAVQDVASRIDCESPRAEGILGLKGVLVTGETAESEEDRAAIEGAVLKGLSEALEAFAAARRTEGDQLAEVLGTQIDAMVKLVDKAKALASTALPHHLEQIRTKIRDLVGDTIPEERTEQEAVLLAVKSDIREELDRLDGHFDGVRSHLKEGGVIGRKLDFLAQELGREVNTLTSKAWTLEIKRIGLDLKLLVDQFREQVQNIE